MARRLLAFSVAFLTAILVACSGKEATQPVNFQTASGSITIPKANLVDLPLTLTRQDTAFFGPANVDEKAASLMLSLRSADNEVFLSLDIYNVRGTRIYALDSTTEGRINVLIGAACDGGNSGVAPGCKWYLSDFFQDQCVARLETLTDDMIEGHVDCGSLGANCPSGTGVRAATGACADGERYEPIGVKAAFRLEGPVKLRDATGRRP